MLRLEDGAAEMPEGAAISSALDISGAPGKRYAEGQRSLGLLGVRLRK